MNASNGAKTITNMNAKSSACVKKASYSNPNISNPNNFSHYCMSDFDQNKILESLEDKYVYYTLEELLLFWFF